MFFFFSKQESGSGSVSRGWVWGCSPSRRPPRRKGAPRRTVFELRKARGRGHILEGQAVALSNIDPVIALIKASPTPSEAKEALISTPWESSAVVAMVERAGADSCRPETLDPQYGLREGKYFL